MSNDKQKRRARPVVGARDLASGIVSWHANADAGANFDTLCNISLDDDLFEAVEPAHGQKISCPSCYQAWLAGKKFRASDFIEFPSRLSTTDKG